MITLDLQFFGGRGASSGGISQSDLAKYGDKLAERFKRYDVGNATIFKVGDKYAIHDLKRPPRTGKLADTLVDTYPTLKEAKANAEKLSENIGKAQKASSGGVGFQYKNAQGKVVTVQKTAAGVTLVNGKPSKIDYQAVLDAQKDKASFKKLSAKQLDKMRKDKYEDFNSHDYEHGLGNASGRGKTVYRPRR